MPLCTGTGNTAAGLCALLFYADKRVVEYTMHSHKQLLEDKETAGGVVLEICITS